MGDMRYSEQHEWILVEGDVGTVGISEYAQGQLGDVVYVELPTVGKSVTQGGEAAVVESVKAASEIYSPVDGDVTDANEALDGDPSLVNADALGEGWLFKVKLSDMSQLDNLMDEASYATFVDGLG